MADWSSEKPLDLIEEYRKYTVPWRSLDKNYKHREERSAVQELEEKYSLDSKSIVNKIKTLRSYFHREHSKVLKKKSGSYPDEVYRSGWFAYKHMLFILQGDEARKGKDTITTLEESLITEEDTDPVASGSSNHLDQESGCGFIETVPAKKKKKCDSAVDEACGLLRAVKKIC